MKKGKLTNVITITIIGVLVLMLCITISKKFEGKETEEKDKEIIQVSALWPYYSFESAVEEAGTIVYGRVISKSDTRVFEAKYHNEYYREVTVEILEKLKGENDEDTVTFIEAGGETENVIYEVSDVAPVEIGAEYIFFLSSTRTYVSPETRLPLLEVRTYLSPKTFLPVKEGTVHTSGKIIPATVDAQQTLSVNQNSDQSSEEEFTLEQYLMAIREELE